MSFIDSSTRPPISALGAAPADDMDLEGQSQPEMMDGDGEEESPERDPMEQAPAGSLKARLISNIEDINLARYLPQDELDRIGMECARLYDIDDNSRADWLQKAMKAMKMATQDAQPKTTPWAGACYSLDTDVLTLNGWRPVAELAVGDMVLSRAPSGEASYHPVTRTFRHRAPEVVHFEGKSIDLLVTPNHRMLVEDKSTGVASFIQAGEFVKRRRSGPNGLALNRKVIPLTSTSTGARPDQIYGIDARAYVRFLGWFVSEGSAIYGRNVYTNKHGEKTAGALTTSSFSIAQSRTANPKKYAQLIRDIEACGFSYKLYDKLIIVHARSMPDLFKAELRSLGKVHGKHLPSHVMHLAPELLSQLLDTMILGDGTTRLRPNRNQAVRTYFTTSTKLADQVQILCQRLGLRGTIKFREARAGGVINGRQVSSDLGHYVINICTKAVIQVEKLKRRLVSHDADVACVEVEPHHTLYVRRNGKAVWCGNSNVVWPLISQSALEFQARAYPAIVQGKKVVRGVIWGSDAGTPAKDQNGQPMMDPGTQQPVWLSKPGEKRERADRLADHMSYQLLCEMPEWEPQTDAALLQMPVAGGFVRKTYFDPVSNRNRSLVVPLVNLVWNYHAPSFEEAPRHTEKIILYPYQIEECERTGAEGDQPGMFLHYEYGPAGGGEGGQFGYDEEFQAGQQADDDAPHMFLEQHCRLDLDDDGYPEPYTATIHMRSSKVVRIVARYDEDGIDASEDGDTITRIEPDQQYTLYAFFPNFEGGSYPMGFGHLLLPLNDAISTSLNQMFDAGKLQNSGGGFISDQLGIPSGQTLFKLGQFVRVNAKGQSIRDAVLPLPFGGPSPVLFQLFGALVGAAKEIASVANVLTGDAAIANAPPTTVLALIEQGMKVYTAIHKRIFRAEKMELDKLYRLNRRHLKEVQHYRAGDDWLEVTAEDYQVGGGVEPIADPTMTTDMQRLGRASLLMQFKNDPMFDQHELMRRYLDAAQIDRIDDLWAKPDQNAAMVAQLQMAHAQAELGKLRAAEMKDHTQAFLNMALARKNATATEEAFIEHQLTFLRLHIESINAQTRAHEADVRSQEADRRDGHMHADRMLKHDLAHHDRMSRERLAALPAEGVDEDAFPVPPGEMPGMPGKAVTRPYPGGVPADMGGLPARRFGGPVNPGQPYLVGEDGPEVFVPGANGGGQIVPNAGTSGLMPGEWDHHAPPRGQRVNTGEGDIYLPDFMPAEPSERYAWDEKPGDWMPGGVYYRNGPTVEMWNRPIWEHPDGSGYGTTYSATVGLPDGLAAVIPTIINGLPRTIKDAIAHFRKTGEHLGIFHGEQDADAYAQALHEEQARRIEAAGGWRAVKARGGKLK